MIIEPKQKRAVVFIDGQNIFHSAKDAFGYRHPNFDVKKLAQKLCLNNTYTLSEIRFYTGIPDKEDKPFWNQFWSAKLSHMGKQGIWTFSRPLRYRPQSIVLPDGSISSELVGQEKGIDIRIALDIVRLARQGTYDVGIIFSQDQDLTEAVDEVKAISKDTCRWIRLESAFPDSPAARNRRGINGTAWIKIDKKLYDACIDPTDYRPLKDNSGLVTGPGIEPGTT